MRGIDSSDDELMRRVQNRDVSAYETLYRRHRTRVFSFALRVTQRPGAAEEVTQDAFISLWNSAHRYDPARASLLTWLLSIVRNRGVDSIRREAKHERAQTAELGRIDDLEAPERTEEQVAAREQARQVRRLLGELPPAQLEVMRLAYYTGLSHTEIATKVNVPLGTVKGRQRLALRRLHHALTGELALETAKIAG